MGTELDGSVGHDPEHGGRVAPPQAEQAVLLIGASDEPEDLLWRKTNTSVPPVYLYGLIFRNKAKLTLAENLLEVTAEEEETSGLMNKLSHVG